MSTEIKSNDTNHHHNMMLADGWALLDSQGFITTVGPFWWREVESHLEMAVWTDERHLNQSGVVQGGMTATLADRAMGYASRRAGPVISQATIALDMRYISPGPIGTLLVAKCDVVRITRSMAFVECKITSDDTLVATANGIFKRKIAT